MDAYTITREIGIDSGHRVPTHGSKCRNLHGHRYTIEVTCQAGELQQEGEQTDMVLDFGFLKEEMMAEIDRYCDHGFICWVRDHLVLEALIRDPVVRGNIIKEVLDQGWSTYERKDMDGVKLYVVDFIPTAEKLAEHWFKRLSPRVQDRSEGLATVESVTVHETPNCQATYYDLTT
jgi:6-pyruvoyltetrahydropterin/6-carboxytetrahydropterin synthase